MSIYRSRVRDVSRCLIAGFTVLATIIKRWKRRSFFAIVLPTLILCSELMIQ